MLRKKILQTLICLTYLVTFGYCNSSCEKEWTCGKGCFDVNNFESRFDGKYYDFDDFYIISYNSFSIKDKSLYIYGNLKLDKMDNEKSPEYSNVINYLNDTCRYELTNEIDELMKDENVDNRDLIWSSEDDINSVLIKYTLQLNFEKEEFNSDLPVRLNLYIPTATYLVIEEFK